MDICTACTAGYPHHHDYPRAQGYDASVVTAPRTSDDLFDHTRTLSMGSPDSDSPVLVVDDGRRIGLGAPIILGRAPRREVGVRSIVVDDPQRTMSKTHLRIDGAGPAVTVTDLNSTNGVRVLLPDGRDFRLVPGAPTLLMTGAQISIGERSFWIADVDAGLAPHVTGTESGRGAASAEPDRADVLIDALPGQGWVAAAQAAGSGAWQGAEPLRAQPVAPVESTSPAVTAAQFPIERGSGADGSIGSPAHEPVTAHEAAARLEAQLHEAARATCAQLEPAFGAVALTAIAQAVDGVSSRRISTAPQPRPLLLPAYVLARTDGRLVGEGGTDRLRRRRTHPAVFVGLSHDVLLAFLAEEGQAHLWMARDGITKLSRLTAKRRLTSFRALEWRYDGQWLRDPDVVLERVLAVCPKPDGGGTGKAWQGRLNALLGASGRTT